MLDGRIIEMKDHQLQQDKIIQNERFHFQTQQINACNLLLSRCHMYQGEIDKLKECLEAYTQEGNSIYLTEIGKVNHEVMQLKKENQQFRELMNIIKDENCNLKQCMLNLEENLRQNLSQALQSSDTKDSDINRSSMNMATREDENQSQLKLQIQTNSFSMFSPKGLSSFVAANQYTPAYNSFRMSDRKSKQQNESSNQKHTSHLRPSSTKAKPVKIFNPGFNYDRFLNQSIHQTPQALFVKDQQDEDFTMKQYQQRLLKSIERKCSNEPRSNGELTSKGNYLNSSFQASPSGQSPRTLSHAQILRYQKNNLSSPSRSPNKGMNVMKEQYMDFTVKHGIVKPDDSNLNQSPQAQQRRKDIENYKAEGSCRNNIDHYKDLQRFANQSIEKEQKQKMQKNFENLYSPSRR